jgi:epsilon-lactone hydrolase
MTSMNMRVVAAFVRLRYKPAMATAEQARQRMAEPSRPAPPPRRLRQRHVVTCRQIHGFDCWTVRPHAAATRAVMYVHGGAYIAEITRQHWELIGRLADAGVHVEVPLYGLAPQRTYRDAYPFLTEAYRQLITGFDAAQVGIAGDSAGGGLSLGFAQTLGACGLPAPARLVLIAPWLDLTLGSADIPAAAARDPWLTPAGLIEAGTAWAGGDDPAQPRLSPVNGPLAGLPPTDIYIGGRDVFLPDVRRLSQRARTAGWPLTLIEEPGAVHVYPLVPAPEGRHARDRIVASLSVVPSRAAPPG